EFRRVLCGSEHAGTGGSAGGTGASAGVGLPISPQRSAVSGQPEEDRRHLASLTADRFHGRTTPVNHTSTRQKLDTRIFKAVHDRNLVYNTCWEDPALDRVALDLGPGDRVMAIT